MQPQVNAATLEGVRPALPEPGTAPEKTGWAAAQPAALGATMFAGGLTKIAAHSAALGALQRVL